MRAFLVGEEPPCSLGFTYVNTPPYEAVVLGSLSIGQMLSFSCEEALAALGAGFAYATHKPLDAIQSYIALHCHEKLTLTQLADRIGFSSAYLCDLFRKKCGIQLFAFIKQVRLGVACHLLRTTSLPVHVISGQVGYDDNSHFCREFKIAKGVTPNAYRQASLASDQQEL